MEKVGFVTGAAQTEMGGPEEGNGESSANKESALGEMQLVFLGMLNG